MLKIIKKIIKDNKGSAIIEMGIMMPLFLMLVFGYIFMVNVVRTDITIQTAVREGARLYSISHSANEAIEKTIKELKNNNIKTNDVIITPIIDGNKRGIVAKKYLYVPIPKIKFPIERGAIFHVEPYYIH